MGSYRSHRGLLQGFERFTWFHTGFPPIKGPKYIHVKISACDNRSLCRLVFKEVSAHSVSERPMQ